jgi:predicted restriction endonuclease
VHKRLKLTIELVPRTSWYRNLRKLLSRSQWDTIRKKVYAEYDHKCGICGAEKRLNCHEIWEYDDQMHVQKLVGLIALCDMCHHVKHMGHASILASEGKLDLEEVIKHFIRVNKCSSARFEKHKQQVFDQWHERSEYEWAVDLGEFAGMVGNGKSKASAHGC